MATLEEPRTSVRAVAKYVRTAPRKAQLVADQIRGRSVPEARAILAFMTRDAARDVEKVLRSAAANAEANHGLDADELVVATAEVGAGPTLKRWKARARGRVGRIKKRTCHISITLELPGGSLIPEVPVAPPVDEKPKPKRAPRTKAEPETAGAEPAVEAAEPPAEETVEPPAGEAQEPAALETAVAEEEAPAPKPRRTPRKKPAPAPEAEAPAGEEKPRRAPRRKPAAADEQAGDAPAAEAKPKRAPRKRKTEETEGSES